MSIFIRMEDLFSPDAQDFFKFVSFISYPLKDLKNNNILNVITLELNLHFERSVIRNFFLYRALQVTVSHVITLDHTGILPNQFETRMDLQLLNVITTCKPSVKIVQNNRMFLWATLTHMSLKIILKDCNLARKKIDFRPKKNLKIAFQSLLKIYVLIFFFLYRPGVYFLRTRSRTPFSNNISKQ